MPKKITPAEAAARQEARKARDRAFHARYRAMAKVENAGIGKLHAERDAKVKPYADEFDALRAKSDLARSVAEAEIAAIKARLAETEVALRTRMSAAREKISVIHDEYRRAQNVFEAGILAKFPDMKGSARWSAAAWKPIEDFLP